MRAEFLRHEEQGPTDKLGLASRCWPTWPHLRYSRGSRLWCSKVASTTRPIRAAGPSPGSERAWSPWPAGPRQRSSRNSGGRWFGASGATIAVGVAVGVVAWASAASPIFWEPLSRSTFLLVHALLRLVFSDTVCRPEEFVVGTGRFPGRHLGAMLRLRGDRPGLGLLAAYLWLSRASLRFPQAWLLFPLGTADHLAGQRGANRGLGGRRHLVSPPTSRRGGFHSQAGWLAFNAVALGLVLFSRRARLLREVRSGRRSAGWWQNPAAAALAPMLSIVAVTMITGAFTVGFDVYYPLRVLAAAGTFYYFRAPTPGSGESPHGRRSRWVPGPSPSGWPWNRSPRHDGANILGWPGAGPDAERLGQSTWLAFRVVGTVITVPIAEELAFRGYLIRRLVAADFTTVSPGRFTWPSFLISSMLFGALHGRWLAGTLAGMAYALAYYRRGEIVDAIAAHATTNALIAGVVLATGSWSLWS